MGKNITIYISSNIAEEMEKFPEVNWSEVCRKAVTEYVETRSQIDLAAILERLKKERNKDYKQGQIVFYTEVTPKLQWKDFEQSYPRLNKKIMEEHSGYFRADPLSPEAAELEAISTMRKWITLLAKEKQIEIPKHPSDAFCEGAIEAFLDVYCRVKPKGSPSRKS